MHHRTGFGLARVMMLIGAALSVAALGVGTAGCASHRVSAAPSTTEMVELAERITGKFSNREQAEANHAFSDARVMITPIWLNRTGAHWFYVEQWVAGAADRPYRQRVYRLTEPEPGAYVIEVFALPEPTKWIGAWKEPDRFSEIQPRDLSARDGCAISLHRDSAGDFSGSTEGDWCGTEVPGASYATSQVRITADGMETWDRAFDGAGVQVWGAAAGPYQFRRVSSE